MLHVASRRRRAVERIESDRPNAGSAIRGRRNVLLRTAMVCMLAAAVAAPASPLPASSQATVTGKQAITDQQIKGSATLAGVDPVLLQQLTERSTAKSIDTLHGTPAQHHTYTGGDGRYRHAVPTAQSSTDGYTSNFNQDGNYGTANVTGVHVAAGQDITVDAALGAGFLVLPDSIAVSVPEGETAGFDIELVNQGTLTALVTLDLFGGFAEDFEGAFPPSGWSLASDPDADCGWRRNDQVAPTEEPIEPSHGGRPNFAGGQGFAAVADADACGPGTYTDASLITPAMDLRVANQAQFDFVASYYHLNDSSFSVTASTDGGATWHSHLDWPGSIDPWGPGRAVTIDLADYLGMQDVRLRFHYSGTFDWWAQVDQVRLIAAAPWADLSPLALEVPPGASAAAHLQVDAGQLPGPGRYRLMLEIAHDTPQASPLRVPVLVTVIPEGQIFANGFEGTSP